MDMLNLKAAMTVYQSAYGEFPTGDNGTILGTLRGSNPKKLNATGAFIDPWQTPYEIKIHSTNSVSIRSAGKNKRFGDADDVTNSP
jgi:hypothetical protein